MKDLAGINFEPRNADEALQSLLAVSKRFLSMSPPHPLGYFPDVYGREMTTRARTEALKVDGHHGYFHGTEQANFIFIGKFATLYLDDLRAWLLSNEAEHAPFDARPRTQFSAWHLSFEYCQFHYEHDSSIPLLDAATGFIPHIVNDLGKAFSLMSRDFRVEGIPIDLEALRVSHWNVAYLLDEASMSTLMRYAVDYECPLSRAILDAGVAEAFPRVVLWALMGLRIQAWYDFLLFDQGPEEATAQRLRELDRKAESISRLLLLLLGDKDPIRWSLVLRAASIASVVLDGIAERSALGVRYGMPAPRRAQRTTKGPPSKEPKPEARRLVWWQAPFIQPAASL